MKRAVFLWLLLAVCTHGASTVSCEMPDSGVPGVTFTLTCFAGPGESVGVYAVEDQVPAGWTVSQISHGGSLDTNSWKVKWGPFFDHAARTLTCQLTPPGTAEGAYVFDGQGSFDGMAVPIAGARQITVLALAQANEIHCAMPVNYVPGLSFSVSNAVRPIALVQVYSVEDQVPAYWTVNQISDGGEFDLANRKVKWGPFFDHTPRDLSYQVTPPADASGLATFAGTGSFDGVAVAIAGQRQTRPMESTVVSAMPVWYQPTIAFSVNLQVTPAAEVQVYAVQDQVPPGWTVGLISDQGQFDPTNQTVKWGPFFTNTSASLSYQVTPLAGAVGVATFAGIGSFNGITVPVTGARQVAAVGSAVVRILPLTFLPGLPVTVTNLVTPAANVSVYAVEDTLPATWNIHPGTISEGGFFDAAHHTVKWGPFFDNAVRLLVYEAVPPVSAAGLFSFTGLGSFDGLAVVTTGARQSTALPPAYANAIVRVVPETLRAGASVTVTHLVSVAENVSVYAIEEQVPPELSVSNLTGSGFFDASNRKIKWGPFFDNLSRQLTYQLYAPGNAGGMVALDGAGSFDGQSVSITGASQLTVLPNHAPVARADALPRLWDQNASMPLSKLFANDSDPDGDPLSLLVLSALSAHGATVSLSNTVVYYLPPVGFNAVDTFTYTVSDGFGAEATATVTVTVTNPNASQNIKSCGTTNGSFWLLFGGIPGRTYTIQATDSLSPPIWLTLSSLPANLQGEFLFIDSTTNRPVLRVYRSVWP